ncbi:Chromobox protein 1, partial [Coemansia erecta]
MNEVEDAEVYEVERIIGRRISLSKKIEYYVFWKGYTMDDCTWESSRDTDCEDVVADFERR